MTVTALFGIIQTAGVSLNGATCLEVREEVPEVQSNIRRPECSEESSCAARLPWSPTAISTVRGTSDEIPVGQGNNYYIVNPDTACYGLSTFKGALLRRKRPYQTPFRPAFEHCPVQAPAP
jgi:hypothetical protein